MIVLPWPDNLLLQSSDILHDQTTASNVSDGGLVDNTAKGDFLIKADQSKEG